MLILRQGARVGAFELAELYDPGNELEGAIESDIDRIEYVELVSGSSSVLRVDLHESWYDDDPAGCGRLSWGHFDTILCTATDEMRCGAVTTYRYQEASWDACQGESGLGRECAQERRDEPYGRHYRLDLKLEDGRVRITLNENDGLEPPVDLLGDHSVLELIAARPLAPLR